MINLPKDRNFQLWEYQVSHGFLLIRSPRKGDQKYNIDVIFSGVEFISAPRHLKNVDVVEANTKDVHFLECLIGKSIDKIKIFVLKSGAARYFIIAAGIKVNKNELDIFDSPFV